jgi:hypothetical protein
MVDDKQPMVEMEPDQFTFGVVGDSISGILAEKAYIDFDGRAVGRYLVVSEEASWVIIGSEGLDRNLMRLPDGTPVVITYKGDVTTRNKRSMKLYSVLAPQGSAQYQLRAPEGQGALDEANPNETD